MDQEYTERIHIIDKELERWLPRKPDFAWAKMVFGDIENIVNLDFINMLLTPLRELLFRGGKRWRPLLMMLVCETLGGNERSVQLAPIVEFSHNASLIHDDIEDDSDERRGKPSVHKIFGVDVAINSGSFFYFLASSCIESCELLNKELIYKLWTECMRKLHLGQSMDINWHRNYSLIPLLNDYFFMCSMKTGSLARFAAELGVHAAGISREIIPLVCDAADKMGVGFQILDDVKNLTTGIPGKKRGDDIVEGKKSFPVILYLNKYPEKQEQIFSWFNAAKSAGYKSKDCKSEDYKSEDYKSKDCKSKDLQPEGSSAPEIEEMIEALSLAGVLDEAKEKGESLLKETTHIFHSDKFAGYIKEKNSYALLDNFIKLIG